MGEITGASQDFQHMWIRKLKKKEAIELLVLHV